MIINKNVLNKHAIELGRGPCWENMSRVLSFCFASLFVNEKLFENSTDKMRHLVNAPKLSRDISTYSGHIQNLL